MGRINITQHTEEGWGETVTTKREGKRGDCKVFREAPEGECNRKKRSRKNTGSERKVTSRREGSRGSDESGWGHAGKL